MVGEAVASIAGRRGKVSEKVGLNLNIPIHLEGELEIAASGSCEYHINSFFPDSSFKYGACPIAL